MSSTAKRLTKFIVALLCSDAASRIFLRREALSIRDDFLSLEPLFRRLAVQPMPSSNPYRWRSTAGSCVESL